MNLDHLTSRLWDAYDGLIHSGEPLSRERFKAAMHDVVAGEMAKDEPKPHWHKPLTPADVEGTFLAFNPTFPEGFLDVMLKPTPPVKDDSSGWSIFRRTP